LFRATLLRLTDTEHLLLLGLHHIVCDQWSLEILYRDLAALYADALGVEAPPLADLPVQYADYAHWQQEWLRGPEFARQLAYWRRRLLGAPTLPVLPTDRPRPAVQGTDGARLRITLPPSLVEALRTCALREGCTLFMALLAAFQAVLARWSGASDILVGVSIGNRARVETEDLIGLFANTLVLRADLGGDPTFRALLGRVREVALEAFAHQDLPFEKLVEALRPARSLSYTPVYQVQFVMRNPVSAPALPGLDIHILDTGDEPAKFDLSLYITDDLPCLHADLVYSTDLFDKATMVGLMDEYVALLQAGVTNGDAPLSRLALDVRAERKRATMESKDGAQSSFKRFAGAKATPVRFSQEQLTRGGRLHPDLEIPFVVEPAGEALELVGWARENRTAIEEMLATHRAVLFRGFTVGSTTAFEQFATTISSRLVDYTEGSTPRTKLEGKVYTSTEFPADQSIPLHNEMSYTRQWPMKIWFFCVKAAVQGGETPIADSRRVLALLDPALVARFAEKKVLYVRNFGTGIDLSWQAAFQTSDRDEVEQYCRQAGIETTWLEGDRLRTRQVCQAIATHPRTGEAVWFNQAHLFHISSLIPAVRESLLATFRPEDLPRNAYYGDGSPIEDSTLEAIRAAYAQATVAFPWREGDVLMLDNMSVAHGRAPFSGARRVVVAMAEPFESREAD
jgi:alpha-ketoglutarate-dependent taurine dioxygenase